MSNDKDIFSTTKGKWDFFIAIVVIALFSFFIYNAIFSKKPANTNDLAIENNDSLEEIAEDKKAIVPIYSNSKTYYASSIKKENNIDVKDTLEAIIITDFKIKKTNTTSLTNTSVVAAKDSIIQDIEVSNTLIETPSIDSKVIDSTITEISEPEDVNTLIVTEEKEIPNYEAPEADCAVIVGAFKDTTNKNLIIEKLIGLGYDYTQGILRNDIYYVGVPIDCNDKKRKQELLKEIDKAFAIKSWIRKN